MWFYTNCEACWEWMRVSIAGFRTRDLEEWNKKVKGRMTSPSQCSHADFSHRTELILCVVAITMIISLSWSWVSGELQSPESHMYMYNCPCKSSNLSFQSSYCLSVRKRYIWLPQASRRKYLPTGTLDPLPPDSLRMPSHHYIKHFTLNL